MDEANTPGGRADEVRGRPRRARWAGRLLAGLACSWGGCARKTADPAPQPQPAAGVTPAAEGRDRDYAGSWSELPPLVRARYHHSLTGLSDGSIVVVGGYGPDGTILGDAELLRPGATRWVPVGRLGTPRAEHSATLLPDGRVLVIGGKGPVDPSSVRALDTSEYFDPTSVGFSEGPRLVHARTGHEVQPTDGGDLWVVGGYDGYVKRVAMEVLHRGASSFVEGPPTSFVNPPTSAWAGAEGIVAIDAARVHVRAPIPKYSRWINAGHVVLPPLVEGVLPERATVVAHELPPSRSSVAVRMGSGALLLTFNQRVEAWRFDAERGSFDRIAPPPPEFCAGSLIPDPSGSAVGVCEDGVWRFDGERWDLFPAPPPKDLYGYPLIATADGLVLAGGHDRNAAGDGVSRRVAKLSLVP